MTDSHFVKHEPCPSCGSKNNLARYSDGHAVCFTGGCDHYERATGEVIESKPKANRTLEMSRSSSINTRQAYLRGNVQKVWRYS